MKNIALEVNTPKCFTKFSMDLLTVKISHIFICNHKKIMNLDMILEKSSYILHCASYTLHSFYKNNSFDDNQ